MMVMVAMSGGVDSSVSALILKEKGHTVAGLTMRLAVNTPDGGKEYFGEEAVQDAKRICDQLDIEHHVVDLSDRFIECVIHNFIDEYSNARTPNPCIECNRNIKFGELYRYAASKGYDLLATGHYANIIQRDGRYFIQRNIDNEKDQSYFLYVIPKELLPNIIFPLNDLTKDRVRQLAQQAGLSVAHKADSQDICFMHGNDYRDFLTKISTDSQRAAFKEGDFVDKNGKRLGRHNGLPFYTIGQRRGLGVSADKPLYVVRLDAQCNQVILGYKEELRMNGLVARQLNMFTDVLPENLAAKTRFRQHAVPCNIEIIGDNMKIIFKEVVDAITVGQSAVVYSDDIIICGGIIESVF